MSDLVRVLGPMWYQPERSGSKKTGMIGYLGFAMREPTSQPGEQYPSYMIIDSKRPSVFDSHQIESQGRQIWAFEDAQRLEIHVEHDSLRIYSHREITAYRTKLSYISGQVTLDSTKKVKPAQIRSVFDDLQVASPMSKNTEVVSEVQPIMPMVLCFSVRDIKNVWLETSQRQQVQQTLATGQKLSQLLADAQTFVHTLTHRQKGMHIYCIKHEAKVLRSVVNKSNMLASMTANTRKLTKENIRTAKLEILDPYDDEYILAGVAKFVLKQQRKQQKQMQAQHRTEHYEEFEVSSESDSGGEAYYDARYMAKSMYEYGGLDNNVEDEVDV